MKTRFVSRRVRRDDGSGQNYRILDPAARFFGSSPTSRTSRRARCLCSWRFLPCWLFSRHSTGEKHERCAENSILTHTSELQRDSAWQAVVQAADWPDILPLPPPPRPR